MSWRNIQETSFLWLLTVVTDEMLNKLNRYTGHSRILINSLWAELCGRHYDESAIIDLGKSRGFLLKLDASIIHTDRPAELLKYISSIGHRDLHVWQ